MSYMSLDFRDWKSNMRLALDELREYIEDIKSHADEWEISYVYVKRLERALDALEKEI